MNHEDMSILQGSIILGVLSIGLLSALTRGKAAIHIARGFVAIDAALRLSWQIARAARNIFRARFKQFYEVSHSDLIQSGDVLGGERAGETRLPLGMEVRS